MATYKKKSTLSKLVKTVNSVLTDKNATKGTKSVPPIRKSVRKKNYMDYIYALVKANEKYPYTFISNLKYSENMFQAFRNAMETKSATPIDLFVHSITFRSEAINNGYTALTEQGNYLCAMALIRMQIDNFLLAWAGLAAKDREKFFLYYNTGKPINKLTDKDGNYLTQGFIVKTYSEVDPLVSEIYKEGNDYVHPSHIFQEESIDLTNRVQLLSYKNHECSEETKMAAKRHMLIANNILANCLVRWVKLKHGIETDIQEKIEFSYD